MRGLRSRELLFTLVVIGITLRIAQYLANRSIWVDEAWLALNFLRKSFGHLTSTLDFAQAAPIGFLFVEEAGARVAGFSEYALRLFPLLCGIASLIAFALLARRVLPLAAAPLAVLLFGIADALIYYSSEVKPYAGDAAASIALVLAARELGRRSSTGAKTVLLALAGLALVAFSFPSVFLIFAIATTLTVQGIYRERRLRVALPVSLWVLGSIAVAAFALTHTDEIRSGSTSRFLGLSGSSSIIDALNFFGTNLVVAMGFVKDPPFNQLEKVALLLVVLGIASLARRDRALLSILLIPFGLAFLASAVHVYPMSVRTELFLVPLIILLLVEGLARIVQWSPVRWRAVVALGLAVAVAAGPASVAAKHLVHPRQREEMRPVLEFVRDHWRPGDTLYVQHYAQYAFLYYDRCGCLNLKREGRLLWPVRSIEGPDQVSQAAISKTSSLVIEHYQRDPKKYLADLRLLRGRGRVWFLYSHFAKPEEEAFIKNEQVRALSEMGMRLDAIDRPGAHAYLYYLG